MNVVKIVVGGQLAKEEIVVQVKLAGGDQVQVTRKGDLQAAMDATIVFLPKSKKEKVEKCLLYLVRFLNRFARLDMTRS